MKPTRLSHLLLLLLAGSTLTSSGCLAAGLAAVGVCAAAGTGAYLHVKGRITRDYPTSLQETVQVAEKSLRELELPVMDREIGTGIATLVTETTRGDRIVVDLTSQGAAIPVDGPSTRVGVRVGSLGDEPISKRILEQIELHIVPGSRAARPGTAPGALVPVAAQGPLLPVPQGSPIPVRVVDNPGEAAPKQPANSTWRGAGQ